MIAPLGRLQNPTIGSSSSRTGISIDAAYSGTPGWPLVPSVGKQEHGDHFFLVLHPHEADAVKLNLAERVELVGRASQESRDIAGIPVGRELDHQFLLIWLE
jgi:hypothetical protein